MKENVFYVKNMVCDRCKMVVDRVFRDEQIEPKSVELGVVTVDGDVSDEQVDRLSNNLEAVGFELLKDRKSQIVDQIKAAIIDLVHYNDNNSSLNLSSVLQQKLRQDYSALSKLFSEQTQTTIERYYIEQRIERVKELLTYGEKSLTEISMMMNYSSVAYLSNQFKSVTGLTPSQYKAGNARQRKTLDSI